MILELLLSISWSVIKFIFIGIILEDNIIGWIWKLHFFVAWNCEIIFVHAAWVAISTAQNCKLYTFFSLVKPYLKCAMIQSKVFEFATKNWKVTLKGYFLLSSRPL